MWKYRGTLVTAISCAVVICVFIAASVIKKYEENFSITSIVAYSSKNSGLISKDIKATISDDSVEMLFPDGVDFAKLIITVEFNGRYVLPEDGIWIEKNNPDRIVEYKNQIWTLFDAHGNKRDYYLHFTSEKDNLTEFKSFSFNISSNPSLKYDYRCHINGNRITAYVPYDFKTFNLSASFKTNGASVVCAGKKQKSGVTINNYLNSQVYTVFDSTGVSREYTVEIVPVDNGLKTLNIACDNEIILDKTCESNISLYDAADILINEVAQIRVRGNYTALLPKKGYKITFNTAVKMSEKLIPSQNLVLLANYFDVSMLRHAIAFNAWKNIMNIDGFTPDYEYVNVFLNGNFEGTYMMTDQVEILEDKIEPGDIHIDNTDLPGFAFLVQTTEEKNTFKTKHGVIIKLLNFDELTDSERVKIYEIIQSIENSLFDGSFMENEYIDVESFANWFIINNFTRNDDSFYMASTYMHWNSDNRLEVGPIWDFDLGFGHGTDKLYVGLKGINNTWMKPMLANADFLKLIRNEWQLISPSIVQKSLSFIDEQYALIRPAMQQNFDVWNGCSDTDAEIDFIKDWIVKRVQWLDNEWSVPNG